MAARRIAQISMHTDPQGTPGQGDVGGMNVVVTHGARELAELGHHVHIFTRKVSLSLPDHEVVEGVHIHRLTAGEIRPETKVDQEALIAPFTDAIRPFIEGQTWDAIHSHHWFSGIAVDGLAKARGIRHVQSFHSIAARTQGTWSLGEQPEGPGRVPAEEFLARNTDAVIAVSHAEAQTVEEIGGKPEKIHVVSPGVDLQTFTPNLPDVLGIGQRPTLLAAARLEPLKGIDLAIEALALVPPKVRPRLAVTGAPTAGFEGYDVELKALAERRGVIDDVWFLGPLSRQDLASAMANSTGVIIPSHSETYGLVALEAAACGVPVIAGNVGGLSDAVSTNGVLLHDRAPATWAQAITQVLDPHTAQVMGAAGVQWAATHTWAQMVRGWEQVYLNE